MLLPAGAPAPNTEWRLASVETLVAVGTCSSAGPQKASRHAAGDIGTVGQICATKHAQLALEQVPGTEENDTARQMLGKGLVPCPVECPEA